MFETSQPTNAQKFIPLIVPQAYAGTDSENYDLPSYAVQQQLGLNQQKRKNSVNLSERNQRNTVTLDALQNRNLSVNILPDQGAAQPKIS